MHDHRPVFVHASGLQPDQIEKTKGALEPGKLADLVILDENPLKVEPTTIKDIAVMETIKDRRTVSIK